MKTSYEPKPKKHLKVAKFELASYIVGGILLLWGLGETVVGAVALALPLKNALRIANDTFKSLFGLDMLYWGITLMVMGALICVLVLIFYAKNADRDFEKSQRRAARLAKDNVSSTTVDAEVQEAK